EAAPHNRPIPGRVDDDGADRHFARIARAPRLAERRLHHAVPVVHAAKDLTCVRMSTTKTRTTTTINDHKITKTTKIDKHTGHKDRDEQLWRIDAKRTGGGSRPSSSRSPSPAVAAFS